MSREQGVGTALLVVVLLTFGYCALGGKSTEAGSRGWRDLRAFRGGPIHLPSPAAKATIGDDARELRLDANGSVATLPDEPAQAYRVLVTPLHPASPGAAPVVLNVSVIEPIYGYLAGAAAALGAFALMLLAVQKDRKLGALEALTEPGGGLSLARVQLLVWLIVALALFGATSVPLQTLPELDGTLAALFGLSGLTTALGAVTSPNPAPTTDASAPVFRDVVEDWSGALDVSRVQCLAITLLAAVALLAAFATTLRMPIIPTALLGVIGASQATYLTTKAVKAQPKESNDGHPQEAHNQEA